MDGNEGKRSGRELAVEALIDTHPNGPAYRVKKIKVRDPQIFLTDVLIFIFDFICRLITNIVSMKMLLHDPLCHTILRKKYLEKHSKLDQ